MGVARILRQKIEAFLETLEARLSPSNGRSAPVSPDDVHDFITLQIVRGLSLYVEDCVPSSEMKEQYHKILSRLRGRVGEVVSRLISSATARSTGTDPAELTFSLALLNEINASDASKVMRGALEIIVKNQNPDGSWPIARLITYNKRAAVLDIASYEVGLALAELLEEQLRMAGSLPADAHENAEIVFESLRKMFELIRYSYVVDDYNRNERAGWSSDRIRRVNYFEPWATAVVLTFLLRFREVLLLYRQNLVLAAHSKLPSRRREGTNNQGTRASTKRGPEFLRLPTSL